MGYEYIKYANPLLSLARFLDSQGVSVEGTPGLYHRPTL